MNWDPREERKYRENYNLSQTIDNLLVNRGFVERDDDDELDMMVDAILNNKR